MISACVLFIVCELSVYGSLKIEVVCIVNFQDYNVNKQGTQSYSTSQFYSVHIVNIEIPLRRQ